MKTAYSFSVLRYIHDVVTGEFVNVGVVLYAPEVRFLNAICTSKYGRIKSLFLNIDGNHYRQLTRYIQTRLEEEGEKLNSELPFEKLPRQVNEFAAAILPVDDSSFQFSPEGYGITSEPQAALEQLYDRYVEKYCGTKSERHLKTKDDVWRIFKKSFEEKHVFGKFVHHKINGKDFEYEFDYCAKNGKWHIQEPVSFDLEKAESIADKANKWLGRMTNLVDGGEKFKMNILLGTPQNAKMKTAYTKAQNILNKMACEHDFVKENEADNFAEQLKKEIEIH